jgi:hypothetical protein
MIFWFMVMKPAEGPCCSPVPLVSMMAVIGCQCWGKGNAVSEYGFRTVAGALV